MSCHRTARKVFSIVVVLVMMGLLCSWPALAQIKYHPPADEVPEEPAPEQASWGTLAVAGLGQDVEGNSRRFEQYYTPPKGGYPSLIQIEGVTRGGNVLSVIELQDITEPGKSAYVGLRDMKSLVDLDIGWRHDEFFEYFGSGAGQMQRDDFDVDLTIPVAREFDLDVNTGYLALNGDSNLAAVDWRAFDVGAGAYWLGDTVAVDAQFNAEDFRQLGPNSEVSGMDRVVTLAVSPARNHRHMLEAQGVLQNAQLDGFGPELERQAVGLTLSSRLATDLTFYGKLTTEETDETITQNAFAVSRDVGRASLLYSGLNKTRLEAGAEFSETEYVERFQTAIDKPQTTTFWAKARYRPCRDVRLSGSFVSRDIDETPLRSLPQGRQGPIVTYDEYERINAKGTYNISKRVGIAGQWRRDEYRLTPEGVETGLDTTSVTAWLIPCDKLTVTGSFLNLEWDISGVDGAGQTAADWVSKLNAYTVGAAYQITDDTWFDGAFTHAYSYGAVMTRDNTVTASWRKRWSDTTDVGLTFTFQDFNEAIPGNANDFEATLIGGSVIHSF